MAYRSTVKSGGMKHSWTARSTSLACSSRHLLGSVSLENANRSTFQDRMKLADWSA
jgi:hypothetical protein